MLAWPWEWEDDEAEDDQRYCEAPACGAPLDGSFVGEHLVYHGGDHILYACSRACAAAVEHRAKVRSERRRQRERIASYREHAQAKAMESVGRACRFATHRATGADRMALFCGSVLHAPDYAIALRYARLAQIDRDLAVYGCSPKGALERVS
jgi:hypothetical protein